MYHLAKTPVAPVYNSFLGTACDSFYPNVPESALRNIPRRTQSIKITFERKTISCNEAKI